MENLVEASNEPNSFTARLLTLDKFGDKMVKALVDFITHEKNRSLINELVGFGLSMTTDAPVVSAEIAGLSSLEGKTFVITGSLSKGRDEFKELVEQRGGKVSGSVSKKTTYLLMGDDAEGTSKHQKALDLGVTILNEEDFNAL
jgi:DNA ligase (NAD+)